MLPDIRPVAEPAIEPGAAPDALPPADPELLETAAALGRRLCRDALWSGERCTWLGERMENVDGRWQVVVGAAGPDLYAGTAGIGLFLARLWTFTGDALVRDTALAALRQAASRTDDLAGPAAFGLWSGLPGVAWAALEVAEAVDDAETRAAADALAATLPAIEPHPHGLDVIGGSAGAVPVLLDLAGRLDRPELTRAAVASGEHLLARAADAGDGALSWDTLAGMSRRHLTGFAHGGAGIAWALDELAAATGEARFADAARRAVAYEERHYSAEHGNWPDFRDHSTAAGGTGAVAQAAAAGQTLYAMAWCHGAPGIGLGRLRGWQLTGDAELLEQARRALAATLASLAQPDAGNFSLCHGHGGNAALAIYAATALGDPEPLRRARQLGATGVQRFHRTGAPWPCGVPEGGETPALMTGLAGIGHFYLRLFAPETVPPVEILLPRA